MLLKKVIPYLAVLLCISCQKIDNDSPQFVIPEPSSLEKILAKGTLDISTFYNTTDYYIYQGITRGFHYELAKDFADYLGVKLRIAEVNNDIDSAINRLQRDKYDLIAVSLTQTPAREKQLNFTKPFFQTDEVLVQNVNNAPIRNLSELDGKEIFIQKNAPYKEVLQHIQDSLNIQIYVTEVGNYSHEDLLHLVETGEIGYTIIDKNIARASSSSMKNIDYSVKLKDSISVSWATNPKATLLTEELNKWLITIRKNGKLNYLYKRYFERPQIAPGHKSKYAMLKKGDISVFDPLLKKESKRLNWDGKLLAAIVYTESNFNPEAESEVGAYGLMQIIPETANNFNVSDYFSPDSNVYAGVQYLKYLDNFFTGRAVDSTEKIKFILASYNAGAGHVLDAMRLAKKYNKDPNKWDNNVDFFILNKNKPEYYRDSLSKNGYCNGGQTYKYVQRVLDTYHNYKHMEQ